MNLLVTGSGKSGSWQIRGVELGRAMGATVLANAIDIGPFDVAVVVKRPPVDLVRRIHDAAVPLVWDIVDAWPQPHGNAWGRAEGINWLAGMISTIRPRALVAATQAMAADCKVFGLPVLGATLAVYLVLGILYESFVHPLTILSGLPAAGLGALATLLLFGVDLSLYAFVGVIMLVGIVKKNAIMMIDFALAGAAPCASRRSRSARRAPAKGSCSSSSRPHTMAWE